MNIIESNVRLCLSNLGSKVMEASSCTILQGPLINDHPNICIINFKFQFINLRPFNSLSGSMYQFIATDYLTKHSN